MVGPTPYVPILKTKQGELAALEELEPRVRNSMTPLLEIVPDDGRSIGEHLARVHDRLTKAFPGGERFFVDFYPGIDPLAEVAGATVGSRSTVIERVFEAARTDGLNASPVTRLGRELVYHDKVREIVREDDLGLCVRIGQDDFDMRLLRARFNDLTSFLDMDPGEIDVVVDLGSVAPDQVQSMALAAEAVIATLPHPDRYRSLTVVSCGFPQNLGVCGRDAITRIPRADWMLYDTLRSSTTIRRKPAYGDYGIQYPTIGEFDPQRMRMSAAIRYTGESEYVISKGVAIGGGSGWEQTARLASRLVKEPEFRGASFSAGEDYIAKRATGSNPVGGASVWRRVGTTQHLTLAVRQYASANDS